MRLHVDDSFHENVVAGALHDAGYATLMSGALLTLTPRCTAEVSRESVPLPLEPVESMWLAFSRA